MTAGDIAIQTGIPPQPTTINQRFFRAAALITAAGVVVKLVATGKEIIVAAAFGRSDAMDAFLAALLIPNLLINAVAESMNQALIPALVRVRLQHGHARAQELVSSSMLWLSILLAAACVTMGGAARGIFPVIASNFSPAKMELAVHLFYALLPCVVLGGIASQCTAVLNSIERFALPALAPAVVPLTLIALTVAFQRPMGIWALALATVIGMALQAGLVGASMRANGYQIRLKWFAATDALREVGRQYGPLILSAVVASGGLLVDQGMAAMLPAGSVSALVYGGRFAGLTATLLAGAVSSAVAPYFSSLVARNDWGSCRAALLGWSFRTAAVSTTIALALIAGAPVLVRITLQHGAFGAADTRIVARVLAMYAIQIPFLAVSRIFYRFVIAMRRSDIVLYCGVINLILDIGLNIILMHWMGVAGIALATSLWSVATFAFLGYWARRLLPLAPEAEVR